MEDIQYLKAHGTSRSFVFFLDSNMRDRNIFPNDNEYAISFAIPFKNVYSIDILDVSIPRTEYIVDLDNNMFVYHAVINGLYVEDIVELPIGDYTSDILVSSLNELCAYISVSKISPLTEQYIFKSDYDFAIDISKTNIATIIGFDAMMYASRYIQSSDDRNKYDPSDIGTLVVFDDDDIERFIPITYGLASVINIIYQSIYIEQNCVFKTISFPITSSSETTTYKLYILNSSNNLVFEIDSNTPSFISEQYILLTQETLYYFKIVTIDRLQTNRTIQIPTRQISNEHEKLYIVPFESSESFRNNDDKLEFVTDTEVCMMYHLHVDIKKYSITAPGRYNFASDRYLILRCKEIESHTLTSIKMFEHDTHNLFTYGIAKIKLGSFGYQNERFDFNKIPMVEFHPIGKLDRLTFRFEKMNNKLYDFKGIHHTMTIKINYYLPELPNFKNNILTPMYDPTDINTRQRYTNNNHIQPSQPTASNQSDNYY